MTKAELIEIVAQESKLTKKSAAEFMDVVFNAIGQAVKKEQRFSYPGFGTWSMRSRKARRIPPMSAGAAARMARSDRKSVV